MGPGKKTKWKMLQFIYVDRNIRDDTALKWATSKKVCVMGSEHRQICKSNLQDRAWSD